MDAKESLKQFVKSDLGCTCPDEVFDTIRKCSYEKLEPGLFADCVYEIGNRLLIFIVLVKDPKSLESNIPKFIKHGRTWRDDEGLNRFRLVILLDDPKSVEKKVKKIFTKFAKGDKKIHLHIKDKNSCEYRDFKF
jgi:hypothetical protein